MTALQMEWRVSQALIVLGVLQQNETVSTGMAMMAAKPLQELHDAIENRPVAFDYRGTPWPETGGSDAKR